MSRDISVGTTKGYGLESPGSISGIRIFSSQRSPDELWGPPSLLYNFPCVHGKTLNKAQEQLQIYFYIFLEKKNHLIIGFHVKICFDYSMLFHATEVGGLVYSLGQRPIGHIIFIFLVGWDWVHLVLRPPFDQLYRPQMMNVEQSGSCKLAGETAVLGENLPQRHFCPPQVPRDVTRTAAVGSQRPTAWVMARPLAIFIEAFRGFRRSLNPSAG
jgi:hypothetical protein